MPGGMEVQPFTTAKAVCHVLYIVVKFVRLCACR